MDQQPDQFWLVWNPAGSNPGYRHESRSGALAEAERLASMNPGSEFYVLCAVTRSKRPPMVETTVLFDGIPF